VVILVALSALIFYRWM